MNLSYDSKITKPRGSALNLTCKLERLHDQWNVHKRVNVKVTLLEHNL
jgi:hypothetical protein